MNQFVTENRKCRKCGADLFPLPVEFAPEPVEPEPQEHINYGVLAANVRRFRILRGMSQKHVGDLLGLPRTYVSKVECGGAIPFLINVNRFAEVLGCTVLMLLDEKADLLIYDIERNVRLLSRDHQKTILESAQFMASKAS